jgi:prefoldin subunit 5
MYFISLHCGAERLTMSDDCQGLASENAALRREVDRLRHEVDRLRREVDRLRKIIAKLRRAIREAKRYALSVYREAVKVRSQHQPRGTWSLWTGKGEVAREVYNKLGEG